MTFDVSITIPVWLLVLTVWAAAGFAVPMIFDWQIGEMRTRRQYKRYAAAIFACGPVVWAIIAWAAQDDARSRRRNRRKRAAASELKGAE